MSGRLVSAVFESTLPSWLKPYAAACATFAADDGSRVFPSVARIARLVGRTERSTQRALQELRDRGVLVVEVAAGRYRPTRYRFRATLLPQLSDLTQLALFPQAPSQKSGANSQTRPGFPQFPQGFTGMGDTHDTPWVTPTAPDPSVDPLRTNQRTRARAENSNARKERTA
jgi:hypothetical protein